MPRGDYRKEACTCSHGPAIHHIKKAAKSSDRMRGHPCNFPGCNCECYAPIKDGQRKKSAT
jgi:hypothetical protein